ncbi:ABC transporter permease [Paracoccus versutus]|nr:ABC transporter permease [Paracoccus versutus]
MPLTASWRSEVTMFKNGGGRSAIVWCIFVLPLPAFLILAYFLPMMGILSWSFTDPVPGLQNYARIAEDQTIHLLFWRTLRICLTTAVISVLVAYLLAYHWILGPPARQRLIEMAILIPFWISVLVRAFGWLILLRPKGLINENLIALGIITEPLAMVRNEIGVVIGMVHFMVPMAVFPIAAVMRQIDPRVIQAARGLGAGSVRRFIEVFLPLSMPGVIGALFIVAVFSLGFFITPAILGGGRVVMVAENIFVRMLQTANWGLGSALAAVLLVLVVGLIWILSRIVRLDRLL